MTIEQNSPAEPRYVMRRRKPALALTGVVYDMCGYRETAAGTFRQTESASLVVPLIVSFGDPFEIALGRVPGSDDRIWSFLAGLYAGPVHIRSFGAAYCLQINFTPLGAFRCFGLPMHEIADRMVRLDDLPQRPLADLAARLADTPEWEERFDLAETFVLQRIGSSDPTSDQVRWAYERILTSGGQIRVSDLAAALEWSRKHLVSRFREKIGLAPKPVARIARFNRAQSLARNEHAAEWADIATECGYADQAHLVREFRDFAGTTPGNWRLTG
jgi:AraC-like DNA-binding protein